MALKNGAHRWVIEAMTAIEDRLPFLLVGPDTDNGGEFINLALIKWVGQRDLFFTRARPYKSKTLTSSRGTATWCVVMRFTTATTSPPALQLLNELHPLVRVRLNMFTATTQAIDWRSNRHGTRAPCTQQTPHPYQHVLNSRILTVDRATELTALFRTTNPADLTRHITAIQNPLIALAKDKTDALTASVTRTKR
jgi:hypothetical protein